MNQLSHTDCQPCDWVSIDDVLQQQDSASAPTTAPAAATAQQQTNHADPHATRSLTQRFTGLFKGRPVDA